jgi:hypothetical protein
MFILNGKPLPLDSPFTHNGVQYPSNWLRLTTLEEKQAIGITEEADPIPHDQRYYWGYDADGNLIPKQLEDEVVTPEGGEPYTQTGLKTLHIQQTKETANKLLLPTDWYIVRKFERNIDIPADIVSYRNSVISVAEEREELISAVTTVEELKGLYESSAMPSWPSLKNI